MTFTAILRSTAPAGLLAVLAAGALSAPASAQLGPVGETLQFGAQIKVELLTLKGALKGVEADFEADLKTMKADVIAGTLEPAQAHEDLFNRLDQLFTEEAAAVKTFSDTIQGFASDHLQNMVVLPNAFVVGDGGLIDDAVHGAALLVHTYTAKAYVKVHAFNKKLQQLTHYDLVVDRRPQLVDPITPTDDAGSPSPAANSPLRIDILLAGSDKQAPSDGRVCLAGTADPVNGTDLEVTLTMPGQAPVVLPATVDNTTHRWQVQSDATLPEGNYAVTVAQGDVAISDSIGMQ